MLTILMCSNNTFDFSRVRRKKWPDMHVLNRPRGSWSNIVASFRASDSYGFLSLPGVSLLACLRGILSRYGPIWNKTHSLVGKQVLVFLFYFMFCPMLHKGIECTHNFCCQKGWHVFVLLPYALHKLWSQMHQGPLRNK